MKWLGFAVATLLGTTHASAQPLVGPWSIADPTEVVILGTPHLSGIDHLRLEWLEPLLARLAEWQPRLIAIEGLSGPECYLVRAYDKSWPDTAASYCKTVERCRSPMRCRSGRNCWRKAGRSFGASS